MRERLQKLISAHGLASRREAERWIEAGRVRVNGAVAALGDSADEASDAIEVDGQPLGSGPKRLTLLLNKPRGYVTTLRDEKGRKNVAELVADCGERVYPVGRLDLNSEGLLLMTNDGELANRLTHPSREVEKVYLVWVLGWHDGAEEVLRSPLELDGRAVRPAKVELLSREEPALLRMTIHEGRNRQIRRLCEAAGLRVARLRRVREGPLELGALAPGKWRLLTETELKELSGLK
jgi:23S rRNA pseudouridine2605 synthase